jgi:hypothetical protein
MNVSEDDLTTLKDALIKGEREVSINDKKIVYRSVAELREAIYEIEIRLQRAKAQKGRGTPAVRQIRLNTRKGF